MKIEKAVKVVCHRHNYVECSNEQCSLKSEDFIFQPKHGYYYDINKRVVIGARATGGGESATEKLFAFLGLPPPPLGHSWSNHQVLCATQAFLLSSAEPCQNPPVAANFTNAAYNGLWYEIGKMQTPGGAAFEKDCVCTTIDVSPVKGATNGDSTAINSCRKLAPSGNFLNATGSLVNEEVPGHWKESFFPFTPKADYRLIYLDDHLAIEYDCTSVLWITNYCIHLLARTPSISDADEKKLLQFANGLSLNKQNIPYQKTLQEGCW